MPAISLDHLVRERATNAQLDVLTGSVLGIDVDHYLRRLVSRSRSPLFTPWGGVGQALFKLVSEDLAVLKRADIEPFFVFSGRYTASNPAARTQALSQIERKRSEDTISQFSNLTTPQDLAPSLLQYLRRHGYGFIVAPYFSGAQLTYMLNTTQHVDAIFTSADTLVLGADRVIIDIHFNAGRITFVDKNVVLGAQLGGISEDQFLDAYLFAGNQHLPIVPILEQNPPAEFSPFRFRAAADVVRQNRTGYQALHNNPMLDKRPQYMQQWQRARALLRHHPFLNKDGNLELLHSEDAPSDMTEVLGLRLPRELYYYLSRGLIASDVVNAISTSNWRENQPLDGGETLEYRKLLDSLYDVRAQCVDLLIGGRILHNYFNKRRVTTRLFFENDRDLKRSQQSSTPDVTKYQQPIEPLDTPVHSKLKSWRVPADFLQKYSKSKRTDFGSLLHILEDPLAVEATRKPSTEPITSQVQLEMNSAYRLLQLRGYISDEHELTSWGQALLKALDRASAELSAEVFLSVELLRLRAVRFDDYSQTYAAAIAYDPSGTSPPAQADPQALILPRICALATLRQNDAPWQGPLDRNVLVAFTITDALRKSIADLFDMIRVSMLVRGEVKRDDSTLALLDKALNPFRRESGDAGLAVYAKKYFDLLAQSPPAKSPIFDQLKHLFPTTINGKDDLIAGLQIWDAVHAAVTQATQQGIMGKVEKDKFEKTQSWLVSRRPETV
ncbi:hypothetical protein PYCC9005_001145 [Savitreella phatthalungensis]